MHLLVGTSHSEIETTLQMTSRAWVDRRAWVRQDGRSISDARRGMLSGRWRKISRKISLLPSSSSVGIEVRATKRGCGISESVPTHSVLRLDIVNTSSDSRSTYSMRRQSLTTRKMLATENISPGWVSTLMNTAGTRVTRNENTSMPMKSNHGTGDISESISRPNSKSSIWAIPSIWGFRGYLSFSDILKNTKNTYTVTYGKNGVYIGGHLSHENYYSYHSN